MDVVTIVLRHGLDPDVQEREIYGTDVEHRSTMPGTSRA